MMPKQDKPKKRAAPYEYSSAKNRKEDDDISEEMDTSPEAKSGDGANASGGSSTTVLLRNEARVRPHMNHARLSMKRAYPINITTVPKMFGLWSFAQVMDTVTRLKYNRWASVFDLVRMYNVRMKVYNMAPWITNSSNMQQMLR